MRMIHVFISVAAFEANLGMSLNYKHLPFSVANLKGTGQAEKRLVLPKTFYILGIFKTYVWIP